MPTGRYNFSRAQDGTFSGDFGQTKPKIALSTLAEIAMKPIATPRPSLSLSFLLLLLLGLNSPLSWATTINTTVDRDPVGIDESFQILFRTTGSPNGEPDFSPLDQDFAVLNQSASSQSSWINGQASSISQWAVKVMAKHPGTLTVPPIAFGSDTSLPTEVHVVPVPAKKAINTSEDLFLEVTASPENPMIQGQVIYTLRLYNRVNVVQARLDEPELADAIIEKLGDDSNFNTDVNGESYSVTERKYAIFPQKSGRYTIKPLVLTADILVNNRPSVNSFFSSQMTKTRRVESKAITLDVKPAPPAFTGKHWLTAQQLTITQAWSGDIQQMKVGEPLTRTLSLQVKGATPSQLPELASHNNLPPLKTYPDQPLLQEQKAVDGVSSFREEKCALIAPKAGTYTLPAIEIPWFNSTTQKLEVARIPATTLTAVAAATAPTVPANPTLLPTAPARTNTPTTEAQTALLPDSAWLVLCAFLSIGWLSTVVFFLRRRRATEPSAPLANATNSRVEYSLKNLKAACTYNDADAAKAALLIWGKHTYKAQTLSAIANFCEARLRDEILALNHYLYGNSAEQWQGKKLFQAFTEHQARSKIATPKADTSLEPLYRL